MGKLLAVILLLQHWQPFVTGWAQFRTDHVQADGSVIDDFSQTTHSEAQAYTLLLATSAGDRMTFDQVWTWTNVHLRRSDGLFAWQWKDGKISDPNNASDADIVIAWALLRAAEIWHEPGYATQAQPILAAIRRDLVTSRIVPALGPGAIPVLLPGKAGFIDGARVTVNLSYWIYPAFNAFASGDRDTSAAQIWQQLAASGRSLTEQSLTKSTAGLPPDWLDLASLKPPAGQPPRASYDALRIPLWQIWAGDEPSAAKAWQHLWRDQDKAWIDLATGATADYAPGLEQRAVLRLIDLAQANDWQQPQAAVAAPSLPAGCSYFSSAIALLGMSAEAERRVAAAP